MIEHVLVLHPDAASWLSHAKGKAREYWRELERQGRKIGTKKWAVKDNDREVYIDVRVHAPNVWIRLDIGRCPGFVSGVYWIKDFLNPTVTDEDDVARLQTFFPNGAPTTETDSARLAPIAQQLEDIRASMFSGEMRKVVQILLGMGVDVPYDYRASRTHGVFVTPSGSRWVIRVSGAGMVAYPMLMCRGKNVPEALGYTPLPTPEPDESRELLTADQMAEILEGKGAFFTACGWAFNSDGHKLANCFVGSEDMRSYSWQYEITIAENDAGEPVSASYTLRNDGYIHGPKTTHMKYPQSDNFRLYSFDPFRGDANYRFDCRAPVFCYYDGASLKTFFYTHAPGSSSANYGTPDPYGGKPFDCSEFLGDFRDLGTVTTTGVPAINTDGSFKYKTTDSARRRINIDLGLVGFEQPDGSSPSPIFIEYHMWSSEIYANSGVVTGDSVLVLIVPSHEREAAYIAAQHDNDSGGYTYDRTDRMWEYKYVEAEATERCPIATTPPIVWLAKPPETRGFIDSSCDTGIRMASVLTSIALFSGGVAPGDSVRVFESVPINGTCPFVGGETTKNQINYSPAVVAKTTHRSYELVLHASNTTQHPIAEDDSQLNDWIQFIEGFGDQAVRVERDAFNDDRIVYSTKINTARAYLMEQDETSPYDFSLIRGSSFGFVGVP